MTGACLFFVLFISPLKLADQYLEQSHTVKYLGLVIDSFLSWHDHN